MKKIKIYNKSYILKNRRVKLKTTVAALLMSGVTVFSFNGCSYANSYDSDTSIIDIVDANKDKTQLDELFETNNFLYKDMKNDILKLENCIQIMEILNKENIENYEQGYLNINIEKKLRCFDKQDTQKLISLFNQNKTSVNQLQLSYLKHYNKNYIMENGLNICESLSKSVVKLYAASACDISLDDNNYDIKITCESTRYENPCVIVSDKKEIIAIYEITEKLRDLVNSIYNIQYLKNKEELTYDEIVNGCYNALSIIQKITVEGYEISNHKIK